MKRSESKIPDVSNFISINRICATAHADPFTIPVSHGSTPTCLDRLYNEILIPGGWGSDDGAATRFAQSPEGTSGATMMYELGVNGDVGTYQPSGQNAMIGIGETVINRWRNDDTKSVRLGRSDWGTDFISIIKNASLVWHHETYRGEGTLLEIFRTPFQNTLNGDPNVTSCSSLLFSWVTAQNVIQQWYGVQHAPAYAVNVSHPATMNVFFKSNNSSIPSVSSYKRQYTRLVAQILFPIRDSRPSISGP